MEWIKKGINFYPNLLLGRKKKRKKKKMHALLMFKMVNFSLHEQAGRDVGRFGTKGWLVEASWQTCFALGWSTWCNESD